MTTFLHNVDETKVKELMDSTKNNAKYFDDIVVDIVSKYTKSLDDIMNKIKEALVDSDNITEPDVEKYFLELSSALYYIAEQSERLSVYDIISKAAYKEVYNAAYLGNQVKDAEKKNKTTVAENQAVAENASIYESAVNEMYSKAYKIVKLKVEAAQTMTSTLSKILSKKMQESSFESTTQGKGFRILNESTGNDVF